MQPRYTTLNSALGDGIQFSQGLPDLSEELREVSPKFNNLLVFDDLMSQATDSPVLSKFFTQGRHRNASTILLLQKMLPKGKFNTDISRNAQYMVLFRNPSDRKQIDIMAVRIFAKDRPHFMKVYQHVTAKPYGYVLVDNQPKTTADKQVVSDVFGNCQSYPHITKSTHTNSEVTQLIPDMESLPIEQSEVKNHSPKMPKVSVKRNVELTKPPAKKPRRKPTAKKPRKQSKPAKKRTKAKPNAKKKPHTTKKQAKPKVYKPRFIVTPPRETMSSEEEEFNCEEDEFSSEDDSLNATTKHLNFEDELNSIARQHRRFGPKLEKTLLQLYD